MSLRFIYGRAGSGKSKYCFERIKRRIKENKEGNFILLVPEQFSFEAEKNLIDYVGEEVVAKTKVLSFQRMAYKVFNEVGGITHKHINDAGKSMFLYKVIDKIYDRFKMFNKACKRDGFVNIISDTITEFKRYNVTWEILKEFCEGTEDLDLRNKLSDMALMYENFDKKLHEKYVDTEDDLTILTGKMDESKLFNDAEVWIDEFFDFTPQEYRILEKIIIKAKEVNITLNSDVLNNGKEISNGELFFPAKTTEEKILKILKKNNIKYEKPVELNCNPCYRFKDNEELNHIEKNLFSFPYKLYKGTTKNICVFKALNRYTEMDSLAKDIIRIVREKNVRFKDIAVVTGDLDGYESLIRAIFSQYNIPHFIDKKIEINNNPLIVFMVSFIEILVKNWSYESVFRYLKTGLTDIHRDDIDFIENYVLANGIKGYKWKKENPWEYRINYGFNKEEEEKDKEDQRLKHINDIKANIIFPINNFTNKIENKDTAKNICTALYDFLNENNVQEKIQIWIDNFKDIDRLDKVNEYSQIWNIVIDVMDQMVDIMGDEKITLDVFGKILKNGFSQYELGLIPPSIDQVLVSSVSRIRSHEIKALYIVGANDGIFPYSNKDEGILSDMDREVLKSKGIELAKDSKSKAFEDQFSTYVTLTIMKKYLRISYSISDYQGKTMRPSIVVSRLRKIFPNLCEKNDITEKGKLEDEINSITSKGATFNEMVSKLRKSADGEIDMNPLWIDVYNWYVKNDEFKEKLNSVFKGFYHSNKAEVINTSKIRNLYGKKMTVSVSRLEKYSQCPFAYFIKYGLKAKERKIYKLSPPDIGTLMHEVIEEFSKKLFEKNMEWKEIDKDLCKTVVSDIVDEKIMRTKGAILNSSNRYKYMGDGLKRILTRAVFTICEQINRGEFKPSAYELSFGFNKDLPAISVKLHSGERVNLIGKVDRVDKLNHNDEMYIRIIDYKSGNKDFKLSDVYYGLQMQLLVYLDALLVEIEEKYNIKSVPAGILYFKIDDPIIKTKDEITKEETEKKILKELKMKGVLLEDVDIIKAMDNNIKKSSDVIPVRIKKDDNLSKSSSLIDIEQFKLLRKYVRNTIVRLCEEMLEGNIEIKPYKKKNNSTPCKFCEYSSICQFDSLVKGNSYRNIREKNDNEVWNLMKKKVDENK